VSAAELAPVLSGCGPSTGVGHFAPLEYPEVLAEEIVGLG
jgi:hypothetical protein